MTRRGGRGGVDIGNVFSRKTNGRLVAPFRDIALYNPILNAPVHTQINRVLMTPARDSVSLCFVAARSDNTTLQSFKAFDYKKGLGPGLYDIHSPVVPTVATLQNKLQGK